MATGSDNVNDVPQQADVVCVGAGHNALVAAAYLLDAGPDPELSVAGVAADG